MAVHIRKIAHRLVILAACALGVMSSSTVSAQEEDDFVPPQGALPASRTGGASRDANFDKDSATVSVLAPAATIGLTTRDRPVIYWYLSADSKDPIEIAINGANDLANPVFETTLKGPHKAGLHKLDLATAKQGGKPVALQPDVKYEVAIEIATKQIGASANPNATCRIMRVDPKKAPAAASKEKDPARLASVYAKDGIWFDYLDALNKAIDAKPGDDALKQKRVKALASQGLIWNDDGTITEKQKGEAAAVAPKE